jgi:hypothetical protein
VALLLLGSPSLFSVIIRKTKSFSRIRRTARGYFDSDNRTVMSRESSSITFNNNRSLLSLTMHALHILGRLAGAMLKGIQDIATAGRTAGINRLPGKITG